MQSQHLLFSLFFSFFSWEEGGMEVGQGGKERGEGGGGGEQGTFLVIG